ncbi:DUF6427 family protein [Polaribacter sp. SA4-10]|uniref:DUF6427 family protein n=1 Tax=Polaribacter sp. SA4-10 TaxID=754397 RepID=UPI000B3C8FC5|nr:DUF6427 family protein [Polaribacter sp. SA4-10]
MLANFFGKSKPINFIVITILFFFLFLFTIFSSFFIDGFTVDALLKSGGFLILFLTMFFFYNFIVSKNALTFDNTYAFFIFTLFLIFFLPTFSLYKELYLFILHLLFLRKTYSLKSNKEVLKKLFDSGFWLGISFIISPFSIVFFILIYVAIFYHQKITIHTLLVPIIGFIVPLILFFTYCFWYDKTVVFTTLFDFNIGNNITFYTKNSAIWLMSLLFLLTLASLFLKSPKTFSVNNSFKKNWILLIINTLVAVSFIYLIEGKNGSELIFLLFPTSIIIANGIEIIEHNLIKNIILTTLLIGAILAPFIL